MILVTGATGFVGSHILDIQSSAVPCPSLRGCGEDDIRRIIEENEIDSIIHTAAISDISVCEKYPEQSYEANIMLPLKIARAARGMKLIFFSSDQVYGGSDDEGPYSEDMAKPQNTYAKHKLEMENRVLDISPDAVILRAEWMYGYYRKKSNYLMNILGASDQISFSSRQYRGLTYVKEAVEMLHGAMHMPGGVYNFGSETKLSMYELTRDFLKKIGKNAKLTDAPPRHNLWMDCSKARALGLNFQSVEAALERCARELSILI